MLLLASLNLYAAYTANIVALLQSPTDSIQTLSDLLHNPLTLAVKDRPYAHNLLMVHKLQKINLPNQNLNDKKYKRNNFYV